MRTHLEKTRLMMINSGISVPELHRLKCRERQMPSRTGDDRLLGSYMMVNCQ